ncbi:MAG: hypothetical protein Q8O84_02665 [Nanoarchaeota archaeon]|nr:hypothetical protein [Nanoarchaeota archaeon]
MKIGIIGPSKLDKGKKMTKMVGEIAEIVSKKNVSIIISPDKNSTAELFASEFKKRNGKIIGIDYKDDTDLGYAGLNREICDELISCETWENQPKYLVKNSDVLIVLGLSVGVTWEICLTKFYWSYPKQRIFIIKELVSDKLPKILNKSLSIEYISYKQLKNKLNLI